MSEKMEDKSILVKPFQLRKSATQLHQSAKTIQSCVDMVDQQINALGAIQFEGISANTFRTRYQNLREKFYGFKPIVDSWADELEMVAGLFEQADKSLEKSGNVLGNSTNKESSGSNSNTDGDFPSLESLKQQREELLEKTRLKREEYQEYSDKVRELGEKISQLNGLADVLGFFGWDLEKQNLTGVEIMTILAGLVALSESTGGLSLLFPFLGAEIASGIDLGKALEWSRQMQDAYAQSEVLSNELTQMHNELVNIDQQIDMFSDLEVLPG